MLAFIGSFALNQVLGREVRRPRDYDVIGELDEFMDYVKCKQEAILASYPINSGKKWVIKCHGGRIYECEIAWPGSSADSLFTCILSDPETEYLSAGECVASLDVLYMLKMSHRYLKNSPHFLKTMWDIQLMRERGATIRDEHQAFYEQRMKDTYVYAHPKLNVTKDDFFKGDGITYVYDHDTIHEAVKHWLRPAYRYYMEDGAEVKASKEAFFACSYELRLYGVLEEAYVLALERSIIPHPGGLTPRQAFDMALMKVCTSITSGWFREFAWENYDRVSRLYDESYVDRFWKAVKTGVVRKL